MKSILIEKGVRKLENYISGNWITGDGEGQPLYDAVTGENIAFATSKGIDFKTGMYSSFRKSSLSAFIQ